MPSCIYFVSQLTRPGPVWQIFQMWHLIQSIDRMNCDYCQAVQTMQWDCHPRPSINSKWFVKLPTMLTCIKKTMYYARGWSRIKKNSPSWSSCLSWWPTPRTSTGSPCSPSCLAAPVQTHSNPELYQVVTMNDNSQEFKWGLWNSNWSGWQSWRTWRPCWCRTSRGQWASPLPSPSSFLLPGLPYKLSLCCHASLKNLS